MPSSTSRILVTLVENMLKINPKSIFEVGCGYGKNAFLAREYLCSWKDEVYPSQWTLKMDCVEIFRPYTELPWVKELYDNIIVADASDYLLTNKVKQYDLTISTDVLEHMEKERGIFVGNKLIELCDKACIINVPTGDNWMNNVVIADNPAEQHQSIWEEIDLKNLALQNNVSIELFPWKVSNTKGGCLAVYKK